MGQLIIVPPVEDILLRIKMDLNKNDMLELLTNSTELFKSEETEKNILKGRTVCFRPLSENSEGPYVFNMESQGPDQYMKLNSVRLNGKCVITRSDGTPLTLNDDLSIVNMFPSSLFKGIETEFNNVLITDISAAMANYQAYIQTTLSYNTSAQNTHLQGQLYVPDQPERFDTLTIHPEKAVVIDYFDNGGARWYNPTEVLRALDVEKFPEPEDPTPGEALTDEQKTANKESAKTIDQVLKSFGKSLKAKQKLNSGFVDRREIIKESKTFDFYIPLCSDILQTDKLLHPSINMKMKLTRASDGFSLLATASKNNYRIQIFDLRLFARYITLSQNIVGQHQALYEKNEPIIYPITRSTMKSYNISTGEVSTYLSNMFTGTLPKSIIIGFVRTMAFHGSQDLNPYNFQHFNMRSCGLKVNGENIPSDPIQPDFKNDLFLREYMEFYRNVGIDGKKYFILFFVIFIFIILVNEDAGNIITPSLYKGGMYFMSFDLTGDQCNMLHRHPKENGNIDMTIVFNDPLKKPITIVVYANYDAQIEVTKKDGPTVKYF